MLAIQAPERSPDVFAWLDSAPLSAFISLELDKSLYSVDKPFVVWSRLNQHIRDEIGLTQDEIALFPGMGEAEICALVRANEFDNIFEVLHKLRCTQIEHLYPSKEGPANTNAVFSNTSTIPMIPLRHGDGTISYDAIEGSIRPIVTIGCPPGFEDHVNKSFAEFDLQCAPLLGYDDLVIEPHEEVAASTFLSALHTFRDTAPQEYLLRSSTSIRDKNARLVNHSHYSLIPIPKYDEVNPLFKSEFVTLANRLAEITGRISSALESRRSYPKVIDMQLAPAVLINRANGLIEHQANGDAELVRKIQGELIELLEYAEVGFSQRMDNEFIVSSATQLPEDYTDRAQHCIWAISRLIRFVYQCWSAATDEKSDSPDWQGYIFFSDTAGYRYLHGEVLSMPSHAIISPIQPNVNWLTLTHELSHSIWFRLDISTKYEEEILKIVSTYHPEWESTGSMAADIAVLNDFIFELFANWFDYYIFYERDFKFYNKAIWSSWLTLPLVVRDPAQYLTRSFFVFLADKYNNDAHEYRRIIVKNSLDEKQSVEADWNEFKSLLTSQFPNMLDEQLASEDVYDEVREAIFILYAPCLLLFRKAINQEFSGLVNKCGDKFDEQVSSILQGDIIQDDIENPLALVRELYRRSLNGEVQANVSTIAALIMSLSNESFVFNEDD